MSATEVPSVVLKTLAFITDFKKKVESLNASAVSGAYAGRQEVRYQETHKMTPLIARARYVVPHFKHLAT